VIHEDHIGTMVIQVFERVLCRLTRADLESSTISAVLLTDIFPDQSGRYAFPELRQYENPRQAGDDPDPLQPKNPDYVTRPAQFVENSRVLGSFGAFIGSPTIFPGVKLYAL
jgi:hypothetical protein